MYRHDDTADPPIWTVKSRAFACSVCVSVCLCVCVCVCVPMLCEGFDSRDIFGLKLLQLEC